MTLIIRLAGVVISKGGIGVGVGVGIGVGISLGGLR
jgi:hypothetical protein